MHSVNRSPEPGFFAKLRTAHARWSDLDGRERQRIRGALVEDFGTICAYCERGCQSPTYTQEPDDESIDHFRPLHRFPDQWLDWLNLVYSCRRCNQAKSDSWPGRDDGLVNRMLTAEDSRYIPVSEYVNPNRIDGQSVASDFFDYNVETGEMIPATELDEGEWSIARRTIMDIDLNDSGLGANDRSHLWNRRLYQQSLLIQRLTALDDFDAKLNIMLEFMLPDKPFSSFIAAYVKNRFPLFGQVFG